MPENNSLLNWNDNTQTTYIKGYKVFNSDWTCDTDEKPFQYSCPNIFEEDVDLTDCSKGFHFCKEAKDCFKYYDFEPENKVAEVIALGEVREDGNKCCTNKIEIVREITWQEVLTLITAGLVNSGNRNTGNNNSGDSNTGNHNSGNKNTGTYNEGNLNSGYDNIGNKNTGDCNNGDSNSGKNNDGSHNSGNNNKGVYNSGDDNRGSCNTGDHNSGDSNTGNHNSGSYNTGDCNIGNRNTGNDNGGDRNTGNRNSGDHNRGDCNSGIGNSGDRNSGNSNSGNSNSGNGNSGARNSGDYNSGFGNTGDWNSGDNNLGNRNSGDWNLASNSSGYFNTEDPKLKFFDKETDMTHEQWRCSKAYLLLDHIVLKPDIWVKSDDMTETEKSEHPEHEVTGGYKKAVNNSKCFTMWWENLNQEEKEIIKSIPNFDADKFYKITGIEVE